MHTCMHVLHPNKQNANRRPSDKWQHRAESVTGSAGARRRKPSSNGCPNKLLLSNKASGIQESQCQTGFTERPHVETVRRSTRKLSRSAASACGCCSSRRRPQEGAEAKAAAATVATLFANTIESSQQERDWMAMDEATYSFNRYQQHRMLSNTGSEVVVAVAGARRDGEFGKQHDSRVLFPHNKKQNKVNGNNFRTTYFFFRCFLSSDRSWIWVGSCVGGNGWDVATLLRQLCWKAKRLRL